MSDITEQRMRNYIALALHRVTSQFVGETVRQSTCQEVTHEVARLLLDAATDSILTLSGDNPDISIVADERNNPPTQIKSGYMTIGLVPNNALAEEWLKRMQVGSKEKS